MQYESKAISNPAVGKLDKANSVSLLTLFQIVTCCCVFFAVLRYSPSVALAVTVVIAPALIRTAVASEMRRRKKVSFSVKTRALVFLNSIGVVLLIIGFGVAAFVAVSLGFGLLGMLFGFAIASTDYLAEAGIIGTVGGMIWGMAGAVFAIFFALCKFWNPVIR